MAFSFYQSLRTVPRDLDEVSRHFQLSPWLRFWRLEVPFAAPGLIWNTMMSMSGGWFFVVASEAITVGDTTVKLPGIGSWLARRDRRSKDIDAVVLAVAAMAVVILVYDQLLFRPIVAWADKFRFEQTAAQQRPRSWVYDLLRRARLVSGGSRLPSAWLAAPSAAAADRLPRPAPPPVARAAGSAALVDMLWLALVLAVAGLCAVAAVVLCRARTLGRRDVLHGGRARPAHAAARGRADRPRQR